MKIVKERYIACCEGKIETLNALRRKLYENHRNRPQDKKS